MKRILGLAIMVITASSIALSQKPDKPPNQEKPAGEKVGASSSVGQELMQIEQELTDTLIKGDPSASERYMADSFTFTAPDCIQRMMQHSF